MNERVNSDLVQRAARRAGDREFYLASALRKYQSLRHTDDAALAQQLGCDLATLNRLGLCRRPATDSATFRTDIQAIAQRFGVTAVTLAEVLREISSLEALGSAKEIPPSAVLMAARDRKRPKSKKDGRRAP